MPKTVTDKCGFEENLSHATPQDFNTRAAEDLTTKFSEADFAVQAGIIAALKEELASVKSENSVLRKSCNATTE